MEDDNKQIRIIDVGRRVAWLRSQAKAMLDLAGRVDRGEQPDLNRLSESQRIDYAEDLRLGAASNLKSAAAFEAGIGVE
jgi:hypothetical protein